MKKILAIILFISTLLTVLSGCASTPPKDTVPATTPPATTPAPEPDPDPDPEHVWVTDEATGIVICSDEGCLAVKDSQIPQDKNLVLMLSKLPIATADMTEDELRDLVVEFMRVQLTFAFRVDTKDYGSEYDYYIKNLYSAYDGKVDLDNVMIRYVSGKYYGGVPYMGNAAGSLYRWIPFYDAQTGSMDFTPIINSQRLNWTHNGIVYPDVGSVIFGNSCSSACFWAWSRVTNEINTYWTAGWIPRNGLVKVGDYELSSTDDLGSSTKKLCKNNGRETMFKAYASTKRADGLVTTGHAVMIVADPVVVYKEDGSIDGEKSYLCIAEQKASFLTASPEDGGVDLYSPMNDAGVTYRIMGNFWGTTVNDKIKDMEWSFEELYTKGFMPFTVPELVGKGVVEESTISISEKKDQIYYVNLKNVEIRSNYPVSDVTFNVKDAEGNIVFTGFYGVSKSYPSDMKSFTLSNALKKNGIYEDQAYINKNLKNYTNGEYTLEIICRLANGEVKRAYSGTLLYE